MNILKALIDNCLLSTFQETFQKYLCQLRPLMAKYSSGEHTSTGSSGQLGLYHPSLAEWFTQTKFCGPAFACNTEDGVSLLKEWRHSKVDKPDLVMDLALVDNSLVETEDKMWMMLDTGERKKRKEELNEKEALDSSKSLVECVRGDELTLLTKLLRTSPDQSEAEVVTAALVAAREGFPDALKILLDEG